MSRRYFTQFGLHWVRNCALRAAQARECDTQAAPCSHHASIARRGELVVTPARDRQLSSTA